MVLGLDLVWVGSIGGNSWGLAALVKVEPAEQSNKAKFLARVESLHCTGTTKDHLDGMVNLPLLGIGEGDRHPICSCGVFIFEEGTEFGRIIAKI